MENNKPSLSTFATVQEYKDAAAAFDAADLKRRAEDAERLPAEKLEWEDCRDDGRCQQAVDYGTEGLASCPAGKCCQRRAAPAVGAEKSLGDLLMPKAQREAISARYAAAELGKLVALAEAAKDMEPMGNEWLNLLEAVEPAAILRIAALVAQQAARIEELERLAEPFEWMCDLMLSVEYNGYNITAIGYDGDRAVRVTEVARSGDFTTTTTKAILKAARLVEGK